MPKAGPGINGGCAPRRPFAGDPPRRGAPFPRRGLGTLRAVPLFHSTKSARRRPFRGPIPKGNAMYSIFYIIGVIVVVLAVLQLIA